MLSVGLTNFTDETWPSLYRTYTFYRSALAERFSVEVLDQDDLVSASRSLDAIVNFKGSLAWKSRGEIECPILFGIHGGVTVDHKFIDEYLPRLRSSDTLIFNCSSDIDSIRHRFAGDLPKLVHLSLPINSHFIHLPTKEESREMIGMGATDVVFGFVARLLPAKNLHGFLRMLSHMRARLKPRSVSAVIVGNYWIDHPVLRYVGEEYPDYIGELVDGLSLADNIYYFPASLDEQELLHIYRAMDLLIHPTYGIDENFGYVPVEAMAHGVPVIGSAYGGLKDTVLSGKTGFLMPTWTTNGGIRMDISSGLAAMTTLAKDRTLRNTMGEAARSHANKVFGYGTCAKCLCDATVDSINAAKLNNEKLSVARRQQADRTYLAKSILPSITGGWDLFKDVVGQYVSQERPKLSRGMWISAAGPIHTNGSYCKMDDPAWPIESKLSPSEMRILSYGPYGNPHQLLEDPLDVEVAQALVDDGWLSVTAYPPDKPGLIQ